MAHALGRGDLPRVVIGRGIRHVHQDVPDRQRQVVGREVPRTNRRTVVEVADDAVRTGIGDRSGDVERRERLIGVQQLVQLPFRSPHEAAADAEVRRHLALDPRRDFLGSRVFEIRIDRGARDAAQRRNQTSFFARLPHPVAVQVGPHVAALPDRRIGIGGRAEVGARIPPVAPVVRLEHRLAVSQEIERRADARREGVPDIQVVDGRKHRGDRIESIGLVDLRRQEISIAIESQTDVETQSPGRPPHIAHVGAIGPQPVDRPCRVAEQVHVERTAVAKNLDDVPKRSGSLGLVGRIAENLPADLEVVIAEPAIPEVAHRSEHLVAADVELAPPRGAGDQIVSQVFVPWRSRVVGIGPIESVLAGASLEEQRVTDDRVHFAFVDARVQPLIERRVLRREDARQSQGKRIQSIGLVFRVPLDVSDELRILGQRIGRLPRIRRQPRDERLDREVRQPHFGLQIAHCSVPPQAILDDVSAQIRARVAEAVKPVDVARPQSAAAGDAARDLVVVDVERLPPLVLVVRRRGSVIRVAARLADEDHLDPRHGHLGGVRRGVHGDLLERSHVGVIAEPFGPLRRIDPLDHRAVLAGRAVGVVIRLRSRGTAADVDARQLQGGRLGEQRPVIAAAAWQARQQRRVERRRDLRRRGVDDRGRAGDGDVFFDGADRHLHVEGRREAKIDADFLPRERRESVERKDDGVVAGRHGRESIRALFVRRGDSSAHHGGTADGHRDTGQHRVGVVGDPAVYGARGRADRLCGGGGDCQVDDEKNCADIACHRSPPRADSMSLPGVGEPCNRQSSIGNQGQRNRFSSAFG